MFESAEQACSLAGVVGVGAWVVVDERAVESAVDEDGQRAGGGGEGFGLADAHGEAPVEGPEGGLAPNEAHGGDAQHPGGAVGRRLRAAAEAPAARDPVLGREGEPGGEVMFGGPAPHVGADLGDELQGAIGGDAIDLRDVDAGEVVQDRPDVDVGFIAAPAGDPRAGQGRRGGARRSR